MVWLLITILSYFFFALANVIDRYLLKRIIPKPKVYTFYTGFLSLAVLFLVPFGFSFPEKREFLFIGGAGMAEILGIFFLYYSLMKFEASRIVPAFGAFLPIFTLLFSRFIGGGDLSSEETLAFAFLVLGSVLITFEREKGMNFGSFSLAVVIAFFFSLFFGLAKVVYQSQSFISGYIWINLASFVTALFFLIFAEVRREFFKILRYFRHFKGKLKDNFSGIAVFICGKGAGAGAIILQNFAISLVPASFLAFISALQGIEYIFVLILGVFLLKERFKGFLAFQKLTAIGLIGLGLILLVG